MEYILKSSISLNFIKKEPVTGSYSGMRYRLSNNGEGRIEACIWPEPFNYLKTKEELKQYNFFELDAEGKDLCVDWLNEQIDVQAELWKTAREMAWV